MTVQHRAGAWNVHNANRRRPAHQVAREVADLLNAEGLDFLTVQEFARYRRATARAVRRTHRVKGARFGSRARRDAAVIVRKGLRARWLRVHHLGGVRWERAPGNRHHGLHPARRMPSVALGRRRHRFRVASPHMPPGPHTWRLRGRAFTRAMRKLRRLTLRWERSRRLAGWAAPGDYNAGTDRTARMVPNARATGRGIDHQLTGGWVTVSDERELDYGTADHRPRVFTVTVDPQ